MAELDKFKRRLIRSVARLLLQEQRPEEETWEQLHKQTGCDCKLLWERMRALTVKKLKRLLCADDRPNKVAAVARMSPTDWLLCDLVLVHDACDVITKGGPQSGLDDQLAYLVQLVQEYKIERLSGDELVEAWISLTLAYNATGRQCSAMLLQRRWYQLKMTTRTNFYKLWHSYRGNRGLWIKAKETAPTPLQTEIAKQFPHLITQPFQSWGEQIQAGKVILRQEFEQRMRSKDKKPSADDDKPDLVMIEPVIETIDLGVDSDEEGQKEHTGEDNPKAEGNNEASPSTNNTPVKVKQEPVDEADGLSNVQILQATHLPVECINDDSMDAEIQQNVEDSQSQIENSEPNLEQENFTDTEESKDEGSSNSETVDAADDIIKQKMNEYFESKKTKTPAEVEQKTVQASDIKNDLVDDIIKMKADEFVKKSETKKADGNKMDMKKLVQDVVEDFKLPTELSFVDDGVEYVDDGIEYVEEDDSEPKDVPDEVKIKTETPVPAETEVDTKTDATTKIEATPEGEVSAAKFDLKLLMDPVVYTTKLDDMTVFKGKEFDSVRETELIESVIAESKPVSQKTVGQIKIEPSIQTDECQSAESVAENMEDKDEDDGCIKQTLVQNDTMEYEGDDYADNEGYESDTIDISEELKVKPTSYVLQKPRSRSYNPIQLCKNPDFNTRLKRLTVGFFSSSRNRQLLSFCKPMTIDLSKAFEDKLVNGTLYLKSSGEAVPQPVVEDVCAQPATVLPSAMPIQSLLDNRDRKIDINQLVGPPPVDSVDLTSRSAEEERARNKVINLRDLSEIRRINQTLLTAEVTPIRVQADSLPWRADVDNQCKSPEDDELKIIGVAGGQDLSQSGSTTNLQQNKTFELPPILRRGPGRKPGPKSAVAAKPKQQNPPTYALMKGRAITIPWYPKLRAAGMAAEDGLITIDTLSKMINKLSGIDCDYNYPDKKKQKTIWNAWNVNRTASTEKEVPIVEEKLGTINDDSENSTNVTDKRYLIVAKKVYGNKTVGNKKATGEQKVDSGETQEGAEKVQAKRKTNVPRDKYCCWAREKLVKLLTKHRMRISHLCRVTCKCCCRKELLAADPKQLQRRMTKKGVPDKRWTRTPIETPVIDLDDTAEDIPTPTPNIDLDDTVEEVPTPTPNIDLDDTVEEVPTSTPNIDLDDTAEDIPTPTPKIRVLSGGPPVPVVDPPPAVAAEYPSPAITPSPADQKIRVIPEAAFKNISSDYLRVTSGSSSMSNQTVSLAEPSTSTQVKPAISINIKITQVSTNTENKTESYIKVPAANPAVTSNLASNAGNYIPPLIHQMPALIPKPIASQKQIVIDASGVCTDKKNDRVVYLNSRNMANKPKESPIFLGKDMILLTTVKFPDNLNSDTPSNTRPLQPSVMSPTLPLPDGVQLVLAPDGGLTYLIDPKVNLNPKQLEDLHTIIDTVQKQLNAARPIIQNSENAVAKGGTITVTNDEPIVINDEADAEKCIGENVIVKPPALATRPTRTSKQTEPDIDFVCTEVRDESFENTPQQQTTGDTQAVEQASDVQNQAQSPHKPLETSLGDSAEENLNANVDPDQLDKNVSHVAQTDDNTTNVTDTGANKDDITNVSNHSINSNNVAENKDSQTINPNEGSAGGRNLLSDLMEMSGISAEDTTPPVQDSVTQDTPAATGLLNIEGDPENEIQPNLSCLTPVTTLMELKYACQHNGKFFKLDFNTGRIVAINVSVRKKVKPRVIAGPPVGKSVTIDLTEDMEAEETPSVSRSILKAQQSNVIARPVKLFKSTYGPTLLQRKRNVVVVRKNQSERIQPSAKHPRKQSMAKIEAKIDLVDSDTPMEEEYLVDNSDSDSSQTRDTSFDRNNPTTGTTEPNSDNRGDSDDSSDDEPLAIKSVKLRQYSGKKPADNVMTNKATTSNDAEPSTSQNTSDSKPEDTTGTAASCGEATQSASEQDTPAEPSEEEGNNMEIDDPEFLPIVEDMSEDQEQEDCILGF